jgi:hypothetical protein
MGGTTFRGSTRGGKEKRGRNSKEKARSREEEGEGKKRNKRERARERREREKRERTERGHTSLAFCELLFFAEDLFESFHFISHLDKEEI